MGLSLKNVAHILVGKRQEKTVICRRGIKLFTHFGVSGPLVLTASTLFKRELSCYHMEIDLKPALDSFQLEQRVLRDFEKYQNRDFFNSLSDLLPRKIIPSIVQLSSILQTKRCTK